MSQFGHLRPFMPQKTRVGNDRSQNTTDVPRRRNRNEKLYKAGTRGQTYGARMIHIRSSNVIESSFATVRHRTDRTKGCLTRDGMLAMDLREPFEPAQSSPAVLGAPPEPLGPT